MALGAWVRLHGQQKENLEFLYVPIQKDLSGGDRCVFGRHTFKLNERLWIPDNSNIDQKKKKKSRISTPSHQDLFIYVSYRAKKKIKNKVRFLKVTVFPRNLVNY